MKIIHKSGAGKNNLNNLLKGVYSVKGQVGWFNTSVYPGELKKDGTRTKSIPVALIAAQNEMGNPSLNIPARPFMRPTIKAKSNEWGKIIKFYSNKIAKNGGDIKSAFEAVTLQAAGDFREAITRLQSPPLKSSTIKNRMRKMANKRVVGNLTKPLVFTKTMLNTLTSRVD